MAGFIFGGNTGMSYEQIQRKRKLADAIAAQLSGSSPKNAREGLAAVFKGIGAGISRRQADTSEDAQTGPAKAFAEQLLTGSPLGGAAQSMASQASATSPAPQARNVDISGSKAEFVQSLLPAAIQESQRTGVDPRIIVAQAAQETGWGRSAPGNNYFGIKSHGQGGGQNLTTHEVINGQRVKVNDSFRTFGSPEDSVRGYGDFILNNPRYKGLREAQGLDAQLTALQASGYATDPNYSQSVGAIARGIQLPQEVASTDPSIGMPPQTAAQAIEAQAPQQMPPMQPPREIGAAPGANMPAPEQMAQAAPQQAPGGVDPRILQALANPFTPPEMKQSLEILANQQMEEAKQAREQQQWMERQQFEQQLRQDDPSQRLEQQLRQAQIDALRAKSSQEDGEEWGLTPVWGKDKDGKTVLGQVSKGGKFKPLDTGGFQPTPGLDRIDTGTQIITRDSRTGEVLSSVAKENRQEAADKAIGSAEGKTQAETQAEFDSITSKMPGLYSVIDRLQELADEATYTTAGQILDYGRSQLGLSPRDSAVARAEYTATVDNQILPLLKDTFGAQFTDAEGIRLARTLGDADKTPTEKQALLRAFIQQKERDVAALRTRIGGGQSQPKAPVSIGGYTIEQVD